jgi:hypothetical protein
MSSLPFNWLALAFYTITSANLVILNGGLFSTEDGKVFNASFVSSQDVGLIQAQGCNIECANICLSSTRGNSLISCYTSCSCRFLITEVPQLPRDQIISAYYRDLGINIYSEIEEGGRLVETEINNSPNPTTVKSAKSTLVSYESEGSFEEIEVKVPDEFGISYAEFELNHNRTQVGNVRNDFFRFSLPGDYWSGEASTKNEVGEEYVKSEIQYDIPVQGISGETVQNPNVHTDPTTGLITGNFSSESTAYSNSQGSGYSLHMDFTLNPYSKTNFSNSLTSQSESIDSEASSINDNTDLSSSRSSTKTLDLNGSYNYNIEIKWSSLSHRTTNLISEEQEESIFAYIISLLLKVLFLTLFIAGVTLLARKFLLPKRQENTDEQAENYYIKL